MSDLKCCPFCGGEAEAKKEIGGSCWKVKCKQCSCEVGRYWFHNKNHAIIAWNTRTPMTNIVEKLEEKTEFLKDCTKYGNESPEQQEKSYSTMMMYEVADLVDDLMDIVKQES